MKIRPLQDWVLVEQDESETRSSGGLIIPDSAQQKQEQGRVIAIGEGRFVKEDDLKGKGKGKKKEEKKFIKTVLKPGDHILYERYSARNIDVDGEEHVLVREEDVLGLLI